MQPFTAPQLASVVTVAKSAELAMPKRVSLPSMLPPDCIALRAGRRHPAADCRALQPSKTLSLPQQTATAIAAHTAHRVAASRSSAQACK